MLNCEDLEFSLMGVSLAASQISMSRLWNKSCCNSAINMSDLPYTITCSIRIQAWNTLLNYGIFHSDQSERQPACNRNWLLLHLIQGMQCPICTKLHILVRVPCLKTFLKGQKSDIIIAPTCWQQDISCFTLTQTYHASICTKIHMLIKVMVLWWSTDNV